MEFLVKIIDILVAASLLAASIGGSGMAIVYFSKKTGTRQANFLLALLLLTMSLTLLDNLFVLAGWFNRFRWLYFLPIYFTFSFGPLLFFFVKSHLYPTFRLSRKDFKHFILPIVQLGFFITAFFEIHPAEQTPGTSIFLPYYGTFEKPLYLLSFGTYLYFARRFVVHRTAQPIEFAWQRQKIFRLRLFVRILFLAFLTHAFFILADWFSYRWLGLSLNNVRSFFWLGDVAAAALLLWSVAFSYANEFLTFTEGTPATADGAALVVRLKQAIEKDKLFLDANLKPTSFAPMLHLSSEQIEQIFIRVEGISFQQFLVKRRLEAAQQITAKKTTAPPTTGLEVGFYSERAYWQALHKKT